MSRICNLGFQLAFAGGAAATRTIAAKSMSQVLRHTYIKTRRAAEHEQEPYALHIHVDSQEPLPQATTEALLDIGLSYDLFDADWHFYGKDGDRSKPFEHHAPAQHMTFMTSNAAKYRELWRRTVEIIRGCPAKCYLEGELIVVDEPLPAKDFDAQAFERIAPVVDLKTATPFSYRSAIEGVARSLPAFVTRRRLDPVKNGPRDRFRRGELHLTVRDDTEPRLLELLCHLGFSVPAIPKLIEGKDGTLVKNPDGSWLQIRDIPLTLQAVDMQALMRVANLTVGLIESVGGVKNGSVKIELATHFELLNGVDYHHAVPPVLDTVRFRQDFEHLDAAHLGSIEADLMQRTRRTRRRIHVAAHDDKVSQFERIWQRTLGLPISAAQS